MHTYVRTYIRTQCWPKDRSSQILFQLVISHDKPLVNTIFYPFRCFFSHGFEPFFSQDYAPLIAENGLDPCCGHLAKGSWLGGHPKPGAAVVKGIQESYQWTHKILDL